MASVSLKTQKYALASLVFSLIAFSCAALGITGIKAINGIDDIFLPFIEHAFDLNKDNSIEAEFKASPFFPITDDNLIYASFVLGLVFSIASIVFGMLAKKRQEYSIIYAGAVVFSILIVFAVIPYLRFLPIN